MKRKSSDIIPRVLEVILGLVFVFSAIVKMFDMDKFEIYIYSYHFFSLNFSFLVARAAIICEIVLGIGLITNWFHKLMWWGGFLMLAGYTLLLVYAQVKGRTDNCHCFGDILQLNPWQSIIKNLILMVLFSFIYRIKGVRFRKDWLVLISSTVAVSAAVFLISPPDNYMPSYKPQNDLQTELFYESLHQEPLDTINLIEGKKVVCFFSTGCDFCKMAAHKLSLMQDYYGFPAEDVFCIFMGKPEKVDKFFNDAESTHYNYLVFKDIKRLLQINNGVFPIIVFLQDGKVIHEYELRNMNETEIKAFFQSE